MNRRANAETKISDIVTALAAHYEDRKQAIAERRGGKRVLMEYAYLNSKLFDAAAEIIGVEKAEIFIKEIGYGVGYAKSELDVFSESIYKRYKKSAKLNMARKLNLWDDKLN